MLQQNIEIMSGTISVHAESPKHNLNQNASKRSLEVEENDQVSTQEWQRKRQKISENQARYNEKMEQQSKRKADKKSSQFKVGDAVSMKIEKVDKQSPFHPNMLLGKITEIENQYACVVTRFGKIQSLISPTRLNLCTSTNLSLIIQKKFPLQQPVKRPISKMNNFIIIYYCNSNIVP